MSWTYDATKLETHLNWVRFRIGDTDLSDQQLSDEEINAILATEPRPHFAAAQAAEAIAAKYTRYGAADEAQVYRNLAEELRREGGPTYL